MQYLEDLGYSVLGIGISDRSSLGPFSSKMNIISLNVFSRRLTFLPNILRHLLTYFEFVFRIFQHTYRMKLDYVHCNDTIPLLSSLCLKFTKGCVFIYDAHELESDKNNQSLLGKIFVRRLEKFVWPHIDGLVVVSRSIQLCYISMYGYKKSSVVLNTPELKQNINIVKNDYLRNKYLLNSSTKIFIYNGFLMKGRYLTKIVEFFSNASQDICLVLLGDGVLKSELKQIVEKGLYVKKVFFHEFCDHSLVTYINQSADFGICMIEPVSLSDFYSLPNKLFEYYFSGLKIVGSNLPEIELFIRENCAGFIYNLDIDDFGFILNSILSDSRKISKINENYSWNSQKQNLNKFY